MLLFAAGLSVGGPSRLPDVVFNDLDGVPHHPIVPGERLASVLVFYWHDCPICNSYAPELNRICSRYTSFAFYIVQVDPDLTPAAARQHAKEYDLKAPVLLDTQHRLVKLARATVTPQVVVMGKNGDVLYSGRIDDLYTALGKKRSTATQHDLNEALDTITAGKRVKKRTTTAIGCLIP
jgi:peroxiredoxin